MKTKYQQQPAFTRAVLWLRYMPPAIAAACLCTANWLIHGLPPLRFPPDEECPREFRLSRWETWGVLWSSCTVRAHARMGNTFSTKEILDDLKGSPAND